MNGGCKNKQAYFTSCYFTQTMIYMHTGQIIFRKNIFTDRKHFFHRHVFISSVLYRGYFFLINFICSYLPKENTVPTNVSFAAMLLNTISNKCCSNRSLHKYILWFS